MFFRYLRRELSGRRKQTVIIAAAMALAVALVMIVNSLSSGVKQAQSAALSSVYGVGTDLTVTTAASAPAQGGDRQNFQFRRDSGSTDSDGNQNVSQSRLTTARGTGTFASSALSTVQGTSGVQAASAVLSLQNIDFSGQIPQGSDSSGSSGTSGSAGAQAQPSAPTGDSGGSAEGGQGGPSGGQGGPGGNFDIDQTTVLGVDKNASTVGPLSSVTLSSGRALAASDAGKHRAVVDASYAKSQSLTVGKTVKLGGKTFTVVGIVSASTSDGQSAADVYIPFDVAQTLSDSAKKISTVYVKADSSASLSSVQSALTTALPKQTINSQADLASTVSGSLSTASGLVSKLGTWLSIAVLVVAFLLAVLLTISGVSRRTREFGTLKAIGWRNGSIVRQVAGESLVQALIGGVVGLVIGLIGIWVINLAGPTLTASTTSSVFGGGGGGAPGGGQAPGGEGMPGGEAMRQSAASAADVVLHAPFTLTVLLLAVGVAVLGGLIAGLLGGWRASRLRPADALRSVA